MIQPDNAHLFLDLYSTYNGLLSEFIGRISGRLMDGINLKYINIAIQTTVILTALGLMLGKVQGSMQSLFFSILYYGVVVLLATNSNGFGTKIAGMTFALPDGLISVIQGGNGNAETSLGLIDQIFANLFNFYETMTAVAKAKASIGGFPDITISLLAICLLGFSILICGICAGILAAGKMGLAVMLAVAPVFILCLAFPYTAKFFGSWLGVVISFILMPVFGAVLAELFHGALSATTSIIKPGWADNVVFNMIPVFILIGTTLFMFKQLGTFIRDLVGGSAWDAPAVGSAIYDYANRKAGRPISNTIKEKTVSVTKSAYSRAARLTK
jgi:type IV secretory pathway VirB6-like protein